nr:EGF domain-containing protein [Myxococcus sp. MH1]
MMRGRCGWGWVALACLVGACDVEQPVDEAPREEVSRAALAPPEPNHADAVAVSGTSSSVLNPDAAVGPPDGIAATLPMDTTAGLMLDLGEGQEATGMLTVYYRGPREVSSQSTVLFLAVDGSYLYGSTLYVVPRGEGTFEWTVWNGQTIPYRYVLLRGAAEAPILVDAVRGLRNPVCGDGVIDGSEERCDDGNQSSGDGCSSVCWPEAGYTCSGEPSVCADVDECALGTDTCAPEQVCVNTPGGFQCQTPACLPPNLPCGSACVDPSSSSEHCGGCGNACGGGAACQAGACVGTSLLQISATWSRPGDADLYVRTPGDKLIHYNNRGPDAQTEYGELDRDEVTGTGPESVFWANGRIPPVGGYRVCLMAVGFSPQPSPSNPVGYTVRVRRAGRPEVVYTGALTQLPSTWGCDWGDPAVASFGIP